MLFGRCVYNFAVFLVYYLSAMTHPDIATLVDPLFRKRERGWSSEAKTG
jgi:hypothetical protein